MIHYHGTPITPRAQIERMAGRHFCVSYAQPQDLKTCLRIGQSLMFDNGAFSTWRRGLQFDEAGYIKWLDQHLRHPHWAIVPDVIDGSVEENDAMIDRWQYGKRFGAPVWHLHEPIGRLAELVDAGWEKVCIGSSGEFATIGTPAWRGRMDAAFNMLAITYKRLPWIHGLRMLGQAGSDWPLASADSTNIAQNWHRDGCAECKASAIDAEQAPSLWNQRMLQKDLV